MSQVKVRLFSAGYCTCPEPLAIQGGRLRQARFPATFVLIEHPRFGPMLYDTGYSFRFFEETRRFPERLYRLMTPVTLREDQLAVRQLERAGLRPADITKIFISHFHADHVSALCDFPAAQFVYLPQAYEAVRSLRGLRALARAFLPGLIPPGFEQQARPVPPSARAPLPPELAPFTTGFDLLGDESLLAVELPGHAAGQMGLIARAEDGATWFFVADAAWLKQSIEGSRPPHPLANFLFPDPAAYRATLAGLHELHETNPAVRIIPSHCEHTLRELNVKCGFYQPQLVK